MSNELLVIFYILATLAFAYLWLYPKVVGENVKLMAYLDIVVTGIPLAISALLYWVEDPEFKFFGFGMNWFFFTILAMVVIEFPVFVLYLKARGLSEKYWGMYRLAPAGSPDAAWASASVESVEKQLNDTRWDGLRTPGAKRFLLWASNVAILVGTVFLFIVGDTPLAAFSLIHILLIGVFWFLLRQSVRLVADAPEEALDEMLIAQRNRSYLTAYRWLAAGAILMVVVLMGYVIGTDFNENSDGFNYVIEFTWPQAQALFWLVMGYALMLPSMAMLSLDLKRKLQR